MKISASIYSAKEKALSSIIQDLDEHKIELFHVDCNDDSKVFDDISEIKKISDTPIDLHIISGKPSKFFPDLEKLQPDYVAFQYENLKEKLIVPKEIKSKLGLAITSETEIDIFEQYKSRFDFILIMATTPGKSGGQFNKENFSKIRQFKSRFPGKAVHVDGGVNGEVSFILRNMGVDVAVSGSYLMKAKTMGAALVNLKSNEISSQFKVEDFMYGLNEIPFLKPENRSLEAILQSIENGKFGFTLLVDEQKKLEGLISNADIRRGLIKSLPDLNRIKTENLVNKNPIKAKNSQTVADLLAFIKLQKFPITYMPVVNDSNVLVGAVTFMNLIKGEL